MHARHYGRSHRDHTATKGRGDFVSAVDLEAQREITDLILDRHPTHAVLAEEEGLGHGTDAAGPLWIVDPLDGTTNFLHGHPYFAASVAVALDGKVRAGAVTATRTGERWWAWEGGGAWYLGPGDTAPVRLRTSAVEDFGEALIGTGFPFKRIEALPRYLRQFDLVLRGCAGIRRTGAAALDLCYLASGRLDGFWELHLAPWDIAAGLIILQEAGGVASRLDQAPVDLEPGALMAANGPAFLARLGDLVAAADGSATD